MIELPANLVYPIVAVGDLHGQRDKLAGLVAKLQVLPEWPDCSMVFLGDFVDRGPDVRGTIDLARELLGRRSGGSAVMGNHDLALVRASGLDGEAPSPYWVDRYRAFYDHEATFRSYLGRPPKEDPGAWPEELQTLREAMPEEHRRFLASLRWVVEAPGHLFLHCGLSNELGATAEEQVAALHARRWERSLARPVVGTNTETLWRDEYPVWIGSDRRLSKSPRAHPGKVQVTGHEEVPRAEVDAVRIRLDTSGGRKNPSACLLRSAGAEPTFLTLG